MFSYYFISIFILFVVLSVPFYLLFSLQISRGFFFLMLSLSLLLLLLFVIAFIFCDINVFDVFLQNLCLLWNGVF